MKIPTWIWWVVGGSFAWYLWSSHRVKQLEQQSKSMSERHDQTKPKMYPCSTTPEGTEKYFDENPGCPGGWRLGVER